MELMRSAGDGVPMPPSMGFLLYKASLLHIWAGASLSLAQCPQTEHLDRSSVPLERRGRGSSVGELQLELLL